MQSAIDLLVLFALLVCSVVLAFGFYELNKVWREWSALARAIRDDDAEGGRE
jgi:hypothetical protein